MTAPAETYLDPRGWVLVDRLLVAAFRELIALPGKTIYWGTVLDDEVDFPAGRVQRLPGGGINADGYEDVSRIEVVTWGTDRPESDAMTAQVRTVLADLSDDEYGGVELDRIREDSGPGRIPDPNQDLRAIPTSWTVITRRQ